MSVDICYLVSHGFASRMITQTDLLGRLQRAGQTVAIICPDRNDPVLSKYCAERDIRLVQFEPRTSFFTEDYLFKRRYYLEDIEDNPALWEKHLSATRFHPARNPLRRPRPYWYYLMYRLNRRLPAIRKRFQAKEGRYLQSRDAQQLLHDLQPGKLVSTYPVTLGEAILLHYGNKDPAIETWIHLLSWDNITCKGRFVETAERYIAWGKVMRDEFMAYYDVPDERIHLCGVPHFDVHCDPAVRRRVPEVVGALGIDAQRPYLLFAMSSPRFAPNEIDVVEWLAQRVAQGDYGNVQLVVRPHPQNVSGNMADASWLPRLNKLAALSNVAVAFPKLVSSRLPWSMDEQDMFELAAMLSGASAVLNSGSTVSIDALMHGKPVLITSFDGNARRDYWDSARRLMDYSHLKTLRQLGGVDVCVDYGSCDVAIRSMLASPAHDAPRRRRALLAECFSDDGRATERVVQVLAGEPTAPSRAAAASTLQPVACRAPE